jgi:hypothetical protein
VNQCDLEREQKEGGTVALPASPPRDLRMTNSQSVREQSHTTYRIGGVDVATTPL